MRCGALMVMVLTFSCGGVVPTTAGVGEAPFLAAAAAGPDAGPARGCGSAAPVGPDCCEGTQSVGSAACVAEQWACSRGQLCTCGGQPQQFSCVEVCGSDGFVPPACVVDTWVCPGPTFPTSLCPVDTCWGEPGDCCGAPTCVNGAWECGFLPAGC